MFYVWSFMQSNPARKVEPAQRVVGVAPMGFNAEGAEAEIRKQRTVDE